MCLPGWPFAVAAAPAAPAGAVLVAVGAGSAEANGYYKQEGAPPFWPPVRAGNPSPTLCMGKAMGKVF